MKKMFWGYASREKKHIKVCVIALNQWEACKKVEKILLADPVEKEEITAINLSEVHANIRQYDVGDVLLVV